MPEPREYNERVSLHPLDPLDALRALLNVNPASDPLEREPIASEQQRQQDDET